MRFITMAWRRKKVSALGNGIEGSLPLSFTLPLSFCKSHMMFPPIQDPAFAQIMGQRFQRVKLFYVAILDQQPPLLHTL